MAEICSQCTTDELYFDIDIRKLAKKLKRGEFIDFLCESCGNGRIYRDENGKLEIGYLKDDSYQFKKLDIKVVPYDDPIGRFFDSII